MQTKTKFMILMVFLLTLSAGWCTSLSAADQSTNDGLTDWLGFAGNFEVGYRKTQFFEPDHDAIVGTWDSRFEIWLPPHRGAKGIKEGFSWGPYVRIAGIIASRKEAWENAWLAKPGLGFQIYPFSYTKFDENVISKVFGPLRFFGEYNWVDYWGTENTWRPNHQIRAGAEYWRNLNANNLTSFWWTEIWGGLIWQSANEFDPNYDTLNFGASLRSGLRVPESISPGILPMISPYAVLESSLNNNKTYYWENRLLLGGGVRVTPSLRSLPDWFNRFVFYAEYVYAAAYYHQDAPSSVPNNDIRVGLSFSLGDWYR